MISDNFKTENSKYKIIAVDDDSNIIDSLSLVLKKYGYDFIGVKNPLEAIEKAKAESYDLMILAYMMTPINGDKVVEEIRNFNKDLYILLLTGHVDLVPPIETIRKLDIQGYCEKSNNLDQLLLLIESGIKSVHQMRIIKNINSELQESNDKLEKAYMESIETLRHTVEAKDFYTRGHSDRVSAFSVLIGEKLGLSKEDIRILKLGGLFHDIGKIGIPDNILLKKEKLNDEEFSEIQNHPLVGTHILSSATIFSDILPIVKHHHEKYNGTGYPSRLAGEDIPYLARITTIADSFDAMASKRPYRDVMTMNFIKDEFLKCSGTHFDPDLVPVFLDILNNDYDKILEIQDEFPIS